MFWRQIAKVQLGLLENKPPRGTFNVFFFLFSIVVCSFETHRTESGRAMVELSRRLTYRKLQVCYVSNMIINPVFCLAPQAIYI